MAGKLIKMSKMKQLLMLHRDGLSNRKIAENLGIYKGTINRYVHRIEADELSTEELLMLDDFVLESRISAGSPAYLDERFETFKELLPYFEKELDNAHKTHVTRKLLWEEYLRDYPLAYRYTQFCYHLDQHLVANNSSAILTHNPGEKLFVDFAGDTLFYVDKLTGEYIKVQTFVASLPYSDYAYALCVPSQKSDDFLYALECCMKTIGGVPKILVPDNLKSAITKSDKYEPEVNRLLEDFANHYGLVVIPTRPRKPKDKALVENQVKLVYQRVYAKLRNLTFFSLEELNEAVEEKIKEHNQTRMQQKPFSREENFLAKEKPLLCSLPKYNYEVKYYADLKIAHNGCIYLARDQHYYSVPYQHIGRSVHIVYTRSLVKVYLNGDIIATHQRIYRYGYTTVAGHMASNNNAYTERSPKIYIERAARVSATLTAVMSIMFEKEKLPEVLYKGCDGLLGLQRKTDPVEFEKACQIAIDNDMCKYGHILNILKNHCTEEEEASQSSLPKHNNIRGKQLLDYTL